MPGSLVKREARREIRPWFRRGPLISWREDLDDLLSNFLSESGDGGWLTGQRLPPLDITETESTVDVRVDVPGIKPDDLDIKLAGNLLTISGQRQEEHEEKGRTSYRMERRSGAFSRSVP
jgi:HSP20 family protein